MSVHKCGLGQCPALYEEYQDGPFVGIGEVIGKSLVERSVGEREAAVRIPREIALGGPALVAALRYLASIKIPEPAVDAAFAAASLDDCWHIEDQDHFESAWKAALLAAANELEVIS